MAKASCGLCGNGESPRFDKRRGQRPGSPREGLGPSRRSFSGSPPAHLWSAAV